MERIEQTGLFDLTWAMDALDGDMDLLKEVVSDVLDEAPGQLNDLQLSYRSANSAQMARNAHALKGSLGTLGQGRVWALAARLEQMGYKGEIEEAGDLLTRLANELEKLRVFFSKPHWEQNL